MLTTGYGAKNDAKLTSVCIRAHTRLGAWRPHRLVDTTSMCATETNTLQGEAVETRKDTKRSKGLDSCGHIEGL